MLKTTRKEKKEEAVVEAKRLEKERRQSEKDARWTGLASDYQSSFYSNERSSADKKSSKIPMSVPNQLEAPLERIDLESGYPVYKAHLLGVGGGGGSPLCPFDCFCCF